mmetsp:Transcript_109299/g.337470  ORF Transcript_109299/g.337470 Transcript_109299/m.337470 type:complete len:85 (-) Transcript_109299:98-352(-)
MAQDPFAIRKSSARSALAEATVAREREQGEQESRGGGWWSGEGCALHHGRQLVQHLKDRHKNFVSICSAKTVPPEAHVLVHEAI